MPNAEITWLNKNKDLIWLEDDFKKNILDACRRHQNLIPNVR